MSPVWPISRFISLIHLPLTFFHKPLARHLAPASLPLLNSPDTTIWEPTLVEKPSKMAGNLFLVYLTRGWFKGKVLLHNVWKFYTRSFSHWQAKTLWIIKTGFSQYFSKGYKTGFRRFSHILLILLYTQKQPSCKKGTAPCILYHVKSCELHGGGQKIAVMIVW